ncbi:MAG: hypothetical protein LBG43_04700 [Treponema sp.]|nr:hypothetical protein [Treponema sp.]
MGINLITYGFWDNKQPGLFFYFSGLSPSSKTLRDAVFDYQRAMLELTAGAGFKCEPNRSVTFEYGVGFNFLSEGSEYRKSGGEKYSLLSVDLGIGGNVHVKLNITDAFHIAAGVHIAWTCIDWMLVESPSNDSSRWTFNSCIGIKPYIGFGWNMYREWAGLGKPKQKRT